jgi:hypothetical protein
LRFLIASPSYNGRFGGVMVLHQLCDALNRLGHTAAIALFGGAGPHFNWAYSDDAQFYYPGLLRCPIGGTDANAAIREFLTDGFAIYPDLIPDNPLGASRVIRYLLYTNHQYRAQKPQEFVLSFSNSFHDQPDAYLFKTMLDPEFHMDGARPWEERTLDITYLGKGPNFMPCHRIPDTLLLTRDWPTDKNQLGHMLRACRYFFTWDSVSQTNVDAVACGAMPILLNNVQIDRELLTRSELGQLPSLTLTNTQDKRSLAGDLDLAKLQIDQMRDRIDELELEWPRRVQAFVERLRHFYQISE